MIVQKNMKFIYCMDWIWSIELFFGILIFVAGFWADQLFFMASQLRRTLVLYSNIRHLSEPGFLRFEGNKFILASIFSDPVYQKNPPKSWFRQLPNRPVVSLISSRLSKTYTLCSLFNNKYSITQNCWVCVILFPCSSPGKCCYTLRSIVFYCLLYKLCIKVKLPALCWIKNKAYKGVTQRKLNSSNTVCKQKF